MTVPTESVDVTALAAAVSRAGEAMSPTALDDFLRGVAGGAPGAGAGRLDRPRRATGGSSAAGGAAARARCGVGRRRGGAGSRREARPSARRTRKARPRRIHGAARRRTSGRMGPATRRTARLDQRLHGIGGRSRGAPRTRGAVRRRSLYASGGERSGGGFRTGGVGRSVGVAGGGPGARRAARLRPAAAHAARPRGARRRVRTRRRVADPRRGQPPGRRVGRPAAAAARSRSPARSAMRGGARPTNAPPAPGNSRASVWTPRCSRCRIRSPGCSTCAAATWPLRRSPCRSRCCAPTRRSTCSSIGANCRRASPRISATGCACANRPRSSRLFGGCAGAWRRTPAAPPSRCFARLRRGDAEAVERADPCVLAKAVKNAVELDGARAAHRRDGAALTRFLRWLDANAPSGGVDEIAAADRLEAERRKNENFRDLSFPTISGRRAEWRNRPLPRERGEQPPPGAGVVLPGGFGGAVSGRDDRRDPHRGGGRARRGNARPVHARVEGAYRAGAGAFSRGRDGGPSSTRWRARRCGGRASTIATARATESAAISACTRGRTASPLRRRAWRCGRG